MVWYHGYVHCELSCRGVWSHLQVMGFDGMDWADEDMKGSLGKVDHGIPALPFDSSCVCCLSASPHVSNGKQELCWRGKYISEASYISPVPAARRVVAETLDFSNAVQGSRAFQKNCQPRPVLAASQLSEKWCGGNLNRQVRILFLDWKKNIFLWFPSSNSQCGRPSFFFHYSYNLIAGFTLWRIKNKQKDKPTNPNKTKILQQPFRSVIHTKIHYQETGTD